jgi:hypothetical protein
MSNINEEMPSDKKIAKMLIKEFIQSGHNCTSGCQNDLKSHMTYLARKTVILLCNPSEDCLQCSVILDVSPSKDWQFTVVRGDCLI